MSRAIDPKIQQNIWGSTGGLEPQRSDLFYIDFSGAALGVSTAANIVIHPIQPYYVKSITLPEMRTKAEPVRRDSVPFNMPSFDDPLDAVKVIFTLDTNDQYDESNVVNFLDAWLALTRAGRGGRAGGFYNTNGWLKLNSKYTVDFRFDVNVNLLRGSVIPSDNSGLPSSALVNHSTYRLLSAWLGSYKISDLSYADSVLMTVEATLYVDDVVLGGTVNNALHGDAQLL